ncbi:DUF6702 family protein [Alienimonas californiensis]|uniref:Uncharacterized protein n=1 Tax=Alienimonas californiensis TaxID=2527989 RepID=A0A517P4T8_9PLAN|nr:DUF6702 family protein [Alienimonas californiensis]QDT14397.1 hypothetical protein CA12_04700 [Alienimonas californiensis]
MPARLILAACCSLLAGAVHPQHVTLAEAEWNPQSQSLEVALRITPAQLEEVVERHAGRSVDLDAEASDAAVAAWLRTAFVVTPPDPDPTDDEAPAPAPLKYVGKEVGISVGWVYFEVPLPGGWEGVTVSDRVRLNVEPAQHNTLVLSVTRPSPDGTSRKERASYTFDRRTPAHMLWAADLEPLKKSATDGAAPPASPR